MDFKELQPSQESIQSQSAFIRYRGEAATDFRTDISNPSQEEPEAAQGCWRLKGTTLFLTHPACTSCRFWAHFLPQASLVHMHKIPQNCRSEANEGKGLAIGFKGMWPLLTLPLILREEGSPSLRDSFLTCDTEKRWGSMASKNQSLSQWVRQKSRMLKAALETPKITHKVGPVCFNAHTVRSTWDLSTKGRTNLCLYQPWPPPKDTASWWDSRLQVTSTIKTACALACSLSPNFSKSHYYTLII